MAYITRIHVEKCRNVRSLDIDLTQPGPRATTPTPAFRHLILTGPNGSGKSGILEGISTSLLRDFFPRALQQRARAGAERPGDAELNRIQAGKPPSLTWTMDEPALRTAFTSGAAITAYLEARRQIGRHDVRGPKELAWKPERLHPAHELAVNLLQFLVNKHTERAFALARSDAERTAWIERWLAQFAEHVRRLTGDPGLRIEFDERAYNLRFHRSDGYVFDLNTLADGHSAAFSILAEILIRIDAVHRFRGDYTFEPSGVIIIDEIETHLHLSLQAQILPFITATFPRLQFILATHSPAVIASISDAIVCDLGTREQTLSDEYRGVPYGTLMKDHFGISSEIDLDSTEKLQRLRRLAAGPRDPTTERELQGLAALLSSRSPALATEVWMTLQHIHGAGLVETAS